MTLTEILTEFYARGFDYIGADGAGVTRATRWANEAYIEDLCEPFPWPDLEDTATGTAPLTITDLKDVIHVLDSTNGNQLSYSDSRALTDLDPDYATTTGTAEYWYVTDEGNVSVYPADTTSTFSVRYLKVPAELATGNDEPILPTRAHTLIVEGMVIRAYRDRDNHDAADRLQIVLDHRLQNLAESVLWKTSDSNRVTRLAGSLDS